MPITVDKSLQVKGTSIKAESTTQFIQKYLGSPETVYDKSVLQSSAMEREQAFGNLYNQEGLAGALRPPYMPDQMAALVESNNALQPCIDAIVTNVDGTGFEVVAAEDVEEESVPEDLTIRLKKFFEQPWPNVSFLAMRKQLRKDIEVTGNGYLEVIRNLAGEIALVRRMDPYITRIMRMGTDSYLEEIYSPTLGIKVQVAVNRRRYVQYLFGKLVYFKEFGAPMQLDKITGKWEDAGIGNGFDPNRMATEVIHFTANKHWELPYGIPRWVPQVPSVIGSRQAEEFNLGFFNAGGIPPLLIIIQGGEAADDVEKAVKDLFYSAGPHKNIAAVLQVQGTSGTIDEPGAVRVTVERFGSEKQKDSMFQNYDVACEQKIRRSWRLPPLFTGNAESHNFATALASYRVAEAQVFSPSRDEFDEIITNTLLRDIVGDKIKSLVRFRSMPIVARDMDLQIKGLQLAQLAMAITPEELIDNLNEVTGLDITAATPEERKGLVAEQVPPTLPGQESGATPPFGSDQIQGYAPGPKDGGTVALDKRAAKGEVDTIDAVGETIAEAIKANGGGVARRVLFDSVGWMGRLDSQKRDKLGRSVAKRLFACCPGEEDAAGKLAEAFIYSQAAE